VCFAHTPSRRPLGGKGHTIFPDKDGNAGVMMTWRVETPNGKEIVDQPGGPTATRGARWTIGGHDGCPR
jgi:hypothetical protein